MSSVKENYSKVTIDESDYPSQILIDDDKYSLLCEYKSDYGDYVKIHLKDEGSDVVVDCGNGKAYVGAFSTVPGKIGELFNYIEATISLKHGFDVYSHDFSHCLSVVNNKEHQLIRSILNDESSFFYNIRNRIRKDKAVSNFYANGNSFIKDNICYIEYLKKENVQSVEQIYESQNRDDFVNEMAEDFEKKVIPAKVLPEGWVWIDYDDGSGRLHSPNGKDYFSYDLSPYMFQGGIEFKGMDDNWTVFYGSLDEFKESVENKLLDFSLGDYNVLHLMRELADNAWEGLNSTKLCLVAGENVVELKGYIYEPHYEVFSSTASLSFNGRVLYGQDSQNVSAYHNEVYQTGLYEYLIDALSYIKVQTKGQEFVLVDEKEHSLEDVVKGAESRCAEQVQGSASQKELNKDKVDFEID